MRQRYRKTTIFAVIMAISVPFVVLGQPEGDEGEGPVAGVPPVDLGTGKAQVCDMAEKLNLTEEQKEQLKEQRFQQDYKKIETLSQLKLKQLELRHELDKKEINRQAIDKIVKQITKLQADLLHQKVEAVLKMKQILTDEQYEKLQSLGKHKMQRAMGGWGRKFHQRRGDR